MQADPPVTRLFAYLSELTRKLGAEIVTDVDAYREVLWFADLPREPGCWTRAWTLEADAGGEAAQQETGEGDDRWLEVRRPDPPRRPEVPEACRPWVDHAALDRSDGEPNFGTTDPDKTVPDDVHAAWQAYLNESWRPWAKQHQRWLRVQRFYSRLFDIHHELARLGEQYELMLSLGFLAWQPPGGGRPIRRHLVTARAALEFEAQTASFVVEPSSEGLHVALEDDAVPGDLQPASRERQEMQDALAPLEDVFGSDTLATLLRRYVGLLSSQGKFEQSLAPAAGAPAEPRLTLAPALVLRRRSNQTLLQMLQRITEQLEEGVAPPPELCRWLGQAEATEAVGESEGPGEAGAPEAAASADVEPPAVQPQVYFPLPSNAAQAKIVDRLAAGDAVLVQGPPGTGKSHTIVNLISHLLATGKRILVTAHTPRALRVLQDKLPEPVAALCVTLLGDDRGALDQLEASVAAISARYAGFSAEQSQSDIDALAARLGQLARQQADVEASLWEIRQADAAVHELPGGIYRGTSQQIAARLAREDTELGWLADTVALDAALPLEPRAMLQLLDGYRSLNAERVTELGLARPRLADLASPQQLEALVAAERAAVTTSAGHDAARTHPAAGPIAQATPPQVAALQASIEALKAAIARTAAGPAWMQAGGSEILEGRQRPWQVLHRAGAELLEGLMDRAMALSRCELRMPASLDPAVVLADARELHDHVAAGGGLGWWIFRSEVVRRTMPVQAITVGGRRARDQATLAQLVEHLEVRRLVEKLWELWQGKVEPVPAGGPLTLAVSELLELHEQLGAMLQLDERLAAVQRAWGEAAQRTAYQPRWARGEDMDAVTAACAAALAEHAVTEASAAIEAHLAATVPPGDGASHPVAQALSEAIRAREVDAFAVERERLEALERDQQRLDERSALEAAAEAGLPKLVMAMRQSAADAAWDERLPRLREAFEHKRADGFLMSISTDRRWQNLRDKLDRLGQQASETTAELAAARAWHDFFVRLDDRQLFHLNAWMEQIRRIGKGTGKYAGYHRQVAQRYLEECRSAIPAWIMPLYRVYESVRPEPGAFDVVIVDEASQCGYDALALLYLGKKVIIVGDAEQISPEAVGIHRGTVHDLIREHLPGILLSESFDPETSLFAHAAMRLKQRVVLREHFRCMPEIIRFSNDLCYRDQPLVPLRQYPLSRLDPVVARYVAGGEADGGDGRVVNRIEAEVLVDAIAQCCGDARYEGRSMGVISLQGQAQADLIETMLMDRLGAAAMAQRRLICGDAYSFQGDERDVIFLSMVAAPNRRIGALTRASDKRRFNVAASRARDQMWLFHSVTTEELNAQDMRRALLVHALDPAPARMQSPEPDAVGLGGVGDEDRPISPPAPFKHWLEADVYAAVRKRGYTTDVHREVGEETISLVIEGAASRLAVEYETDEALSASQFQRDLARQRMLERCGWVFHRIRGSAYYRNPSRALVPLWSHLTRRGIVSE